MFPCHNVGDEFVFERCGTADDFWHMGLNALKQTVNTTEGIAGGKAFPYCSEAREAISRYICTGLQGSSIMRGWMNDERIMIACCSDGTRPVIFKIERMDYKILYIDGIHDDKCKNEIKGIIEQIDGVTDIIFREDYIEVYLQKDVDDTVLKNSVAE